MKNRGFSTLELLIAFAIAMLIIVAVVSVMFGAQYWLAASQTSGEGLYKAKAMLEDLRAAARQDFPSAVSSPYAKDTTDASCAAAGFCYYKQEIVTDYSPCAKLAEAYVEWKVNGYATTSSVLYTNLTSPNEIVALGGDCLLTQPSGNWTSVATQNIGGIPGTPTGIDVLNDIAYVTTDTSPYFAIIKDGASVAFTNGFKDYVKLNGIDVVRDESTGRTYAYVARNDGTAQLDIIDVTDPANPATTTDAFKLPDSSNPGWRVTVYDRVAYVGTFDIGGKELSAVNVSDASAPVALGSADINTTAYDIVVRDEDISGTSHRLAYLATPADDAALQIWDVTTASAMTKLSAGPAGVSHDGRSVFVSGKKAYLGLESGISTDDLYVLDVSKPTITPTVITSDDESGSITGLNVSGNFLYAARTSGSGAIRVLNPDTLASLYDINLNNLVDNGMDVDGNAVYGVTNSWLRIYTSP